MDMKGAGERDAGWYNEEAIKEHRKWKDKPAASFSNLQDMEQAAWLIHAFLILQEERVHG